MITSLRCKWDQDSINHSKRDSVSLQLQLCPLHFAAGQVCRRNKLVGRSFPTTLRRHRASQHLREVKKCLDVLSQGRQVPVLHTKEQPIHTQHVQNQTSSEGQNHFATKTFSRKVSSSPNKATPEGGFLTSTFAWLSLTFFGRKWTPTAYLSLWVQSSICASTWLVKELLMTKLGWPMAQPRLTRRPSASRMM